MKIDVTNAFLWRRPRVSRAGWPPDSVPCRLSVIGEKPRVRRANNGISLIPLQYPLTTTKCPMRLHRKYYLLTDHHSHGEHIIDVNLSNKKVPSILYMMRESTSEGFHWTWKESCLWFRATNYKEPKVTMFSDTFNVSQFHVCTSWRGYVIIIVYKLIYNPIQKISSRQEHGAKRKFWVPMKNLSCVLMRTEKWSEDPNERGWGWGWRWRRGEERMIGEGLAYHLGEDDLLLN